MQVFSMTMSHFDVGILVEILQSSCLQTTQEKHVSTINPPKKQHTSYLVISRILGFFPTSEGSKSQVHNLLPSYRSLPPSGNFFNLATNKKNKEFCEVSPCEGPICRVAPVVSSSNLGRSHWNLNVKIIMWIKHESNFWLTPRKHVAASSHTSLREGCDRNHWKYGKCKDVMCLQIYLNLAASKTKVGVLKPEVISWAALILRISQVTTWWSFICVKRICFHMFPSNSATKIPSKELTYPWPRHFSR